MKVLSLGKNQIKELKGSLPVGLKVLILRENLIESIDGYDFPPKLETLDLDENKI